MAWFEGIPPVTGTTDSVCIYKMYGRYFIRSRSSLTSERVRKDPAFRKTMEYATLLAKASCIASTVYAGLRADQRQHSLYRKLTGEAMTWLKYEWKETDVLEWLQQRYTPQEINLFYQHLDGQRVAAEVSKTEEHAMTCFKVRMNRRLLRALNQGNFSMMEDWPPDKRKKRS